MCFYYFCSAIEEKAVLIRSDAMDPVFYCEKHAPVPTFCVCKQMFVEDGRTMVECDSCRDWFHYICVGVESDFDPTTFQCPNCEAGCDVSVADMEYNANKEMLADKAKSRLGVTDEMIHFNAMAWL